MDNQTFKRLVERFDTEPRFNEKLNEIINAVYADLAVFGDARFRIFQNDEGKLDCEHLDDKVRDV